MPEGDTIYRAARTLHRALAGKRVTLFETVLPKLARINDDAGLAGRNVERVEAQGKWMRMQFSGDLILLTHMLMSGSWHIYRPGEAWKRHKTHMRILIGTKEMVAVGFNVPVAEFHTASSLRRRDGLRTLGPSVLAEEFDGARILANLRAHPDKEIGAALLEQSLLAGVGNVFKSEVCFGSRVNPFRPIGSLSITELSSVVTTARTFLRANVAETAPQRAVNLDGLRRTTGSFGNEDRLWVYGRRGKACRRCGTEIQVRRQQPGARVTFWCPGCQPMHPGA